MVKVVAPMLSLAASGTLGKAITFTTWKGRPVVRTRVIPANPRTGLQVGMRSGIAAYPYIWNERLAAAGQALWNAAVGTEAISGFNLFTRLSQRSLRNNYGPFYVPAKQGQAGTPAPPGDAAATQDGTDLDITFTDNPLGYGILLFHSLTTPFTPGIINLTAVVPAGLQLWVHRNPGVGTHYYDCRTFAEDGGVGALETQFIGTIV